MSLICNRFDPIVRLMQGFIRNSIMLLMLPGRMNRRSGLSNLRAWADTHSDEYSRMR